jgi:hypothetical protein
MKINFVEFGTDRMDEKFNKIATFSRAANSGKGKSVGSQAEPQQGIAPTLSAGGIPTPHRVKGVAGNSNSTREPGVQVERISICCDMLHKATL